MRHLMCLDSMCDAVTVLRTLVDLTLHTCTVMYTHSVDVVLQRDVVWHADPVLHVDVVLQSC